MLPLQGTRVQSPVRKLRSHMPCGAAKKNKKISGLPWWRSGQESACQCRGHGFDPWSGRIPPASEQLSPCATTTEPACCNYWRLGALQPGFHKRSHCNEKPMHHHEEEPPFTATGESPSAAMKALCSQQLNKYFLNLCYNSGGGHHQPTPDSPLSSMKPPQISSPLSIPLRLPPHRLDQLFTFPVSNLKKKNLTEV